MERVDTGGNICLLYTSICAQIEQEIAELDDEEKAMFLEELGLKESGLEKLIKASYSLLLSHLLLLSGS